MVAWLQKIADKPVRRVVGLMSGTSADGIDAVLVEIEGCGTATRVQILAFQTLALADLLREQVFGLFDAAASLDDLCRLNFALGEAFAAASLAVIEAAGLHAAEVDLIGSHGQTVRHLPFGQPGSTLQIGEPAVIAQRTGITTVADFRPADMAVGGQGAPLVPLVDYLLFAHQEKGRLLLNIGGIANVTVLPAGCDPEQVQAFDLGPGNMLLDAAVVHLTGGRERFDRDGRRGAAGQIDPQVLARLLQHDFLQRPPPKSTGREEFGTPFFAELLRQTHLSAADLVATLTAFSARAIADGIEKFVLPTVPAGELWVGGGGVHNVHLMDKIRGELPQLRLAPLDDLGVSADAREALSFAVLANETLMGQAGNLPTATGAARPVVLGKVVPGHIF
jgi:anhydro-N-acetylmuramic acid kinase